MAIYFICQPDFKGNTLYFLALRKFSSYEIWLSLGFLTLRKFSSNEIWLSLGFLTLRKFSSNEILLSLGFLTLRNFFYSKCLKLPNSWRKVFFQGWNFFKMLRKILALENFASIFHFEWKIFILEKTVQLCSRTLQLNLSINFTFISSSLDLGTYSYII